MEVTLRETNELCRVRRIDTTRVAPNASGMDAPLGWTHPHRVVDPRVRRPIVIGTRQQLLKGQMPPPISAAISGGSSQQFSEFV